MEEQIDNGFFHLGVFGFDLQTELEINVKPTGKCDVER